MLWNFSLFLALYWQYWAKKVKNFTTRQIFVSKKKIKNAQSLTPSWTFWDNLFFEIFWKSKACCEICNFLGSILANRGVAMNSAWASFLIHSSSVPQSRITCVLDSCEKPTICLCPLAHRPFALWTSLSRPADFKRENHPEPSTLRARRWRHVEASDFLHYRFFHFVFRFGLPKGLKIGLKVRQLIFEYELHWRQFSYSFVKCVYQLWQSVSWLYVKSQALASVHWPIGLLLL